MKKNTLVIGASENPDRYSNKAIRSLLHHGHDVVGIGSRKGQVMDVSFDKEKVDFEDIDTVTMYINPTLQKSYYDYIIGLRPKRIIFNPGTENPELTQLAHAAGITTLNACTLVLLSIGKY